MTHPAPQHKATTATLQLSHSHISIELSPLHTLSPRSFTSGQLVNMKAVALIALLALSYAIGKPVVTVVYVLRW